MKKNETQNTSTKKGRLKQELQEKWEETKIREYFVRLFGRYDIHNEEQFIHYGKWLIFGALIFVELLVLFDRLGIFLKNKNWSSLIFVLIVEAVLAFSQAAKFFFVKEKKAKQVFYVIDALAACSFMFVSNNDYTLIIYLLILTMFYIETEKTYPSLIILVCSVLLYIISSWGKAIFIVGEEIKLGYAIMQSVGAIFSMGLHFVVVHTALAFYKQFLRLDKALKELDESKKALEKAYAVVAEVSVLEERQRIAKDIHDTAGHSLTTVIMQTEAAKRILETGDETSEAKSKIVAANLQAKNALEELRNSVHLLSGIQEGQTLKDGLLKIIHDSTDGTGIVIRSEIEELQVAPTKHRFLCNTLKEGISNGLRHGNATAFWFELKREQDSIVFVLLDNGKGVNAENLEKGFGLTTMQDRAKSLGGNVFFSSEEGDGFEIRLQLPMDK